MTTNDTLDRNKAIYRRYIQQVFNEGRVDLLDELLAVLSQEILMTNNRYRSHCFKQQFQRQIQ